MLGIRRNHNRRAELYARKVREGEGHKDDIALTKRRVRDHA